MSRNDTGSAVEKSDAQIKALRQALAWAVSGFWSRRRGTMIDPSALSDGVSTGAIAGAIFAAGTAIARAVRSGLNRVAASYDRMNTAVDSNTASQHKTVARITAMESVVDEGRADIREMKDLVQKLDRGAQPGRRARTHSTGGWTNQHDREPPLPCSAIDPPSELIDDLKDGHARSDHRALLFDLVEGALVVEKKASEHGARVLQGERCGKVRVWIG
jgi:hypothetical protein